MLSEGGNTYLNGPGLDAPLKRNNGSANAYYLSDQLGSITHLTDAAGVSSGDYQDDPYGQQLSSSPVRGNPLSFMDSFGVVARYIGPINLESFGI